MAEESLRQKKKLATRQALADAAFELAVERGLDDLVVEDIVNKAGYSRRTFANYFSCKEEAIASALSMTDYPDHNDSSFASLDGLTPLATIELMIKHSFNLDRLRRLHQLISLSKDHPTLKLYVAGVLKETQEFAKRGISEEFGDKYPEEYYHLLIGAVFGAIMPVLDETIKVRLPGDDSEKQNYKGFDEYIEIAFDRLRKGFE